MQLSPVEAVPEGRDSPCARGEIEGLQRLWRLPRSPDCPRTMPGALESHPYASVRHRFGDGRKLGQGRQGLPITQPTSLLALVGASSLPAEYRAFIIERRSV